LFVSGLWAGVAGLVGGHALGLGSVGCLVVTGGLAELVVQGIETLGIGAVEVEPPERFTLICLSVLKNMRERRCFAEDYHC
jgi:hypothetical protein